jgi:hypothetical protein
MNVSMAGCILAGSGVANAVKNSGMPAYASCAYDLIMSWVMVGSAATRPVPSTSGSFACSVWIIWTTWADS